MTTRAPLILLRLEDKSFRELFRDVVQSRSATVERISRFEKSAEEHMQRAHHYQEQAQELKSNLANMDAYLLEAWAIYEKSQHRGVFPSASSKRSRDRHAFKENVNNSSTSTYVASVPTC